MNYKDVKFINEEEVLDSGLSSEHKQIEGVFYGYAYFETEKQIHFIPVDSNNNLVMSTNIWDFIKKIPNIK